MEATTATQVRLPTLGEQAPAFEAITTQGTIRLEDFKGRWLILFSHPADFTPVCTTEFIAFAQVYDDLQQRNADLLGLSIDSVYSHIAWLRNIEEKTGTRIPFPVIADVDRRVAMAYGMIQPGQSQTETSRCVFIIDPEQKVRAMIYYPLTTGRNMQEILRLIDALQTTDADKVATPANWTPGQPVIVPPPVTQEDADERVQTPGVECVDWYFCRKRL